MMHNIDKASSGIEVLDQLIDYLYVGDNVVWEVESGMKYEIFLEAFIKRSFDESQPVVYVSFNTSPQSVLNRYDPLVKGNLGSNFVLIDCFSSGKGRKDKTCMSFYEKSSLGGIYLINENKNPDELIDVLKKCNDKKYYGCRYIFDSITGMQEIWKDPIIARDFFTYMCPRLFDLNTIAYWIIEKKAHSEVFNANIRHITQVVIELFREEDKFALQPIKLSRRKSNKHFKKVLFSIEDGAVNIIDARKEQKITIGNTIREIRKLKGINQKEFAERINMTPSYISQIENNQLIPSLPAFLDICEELQVDANTLLKKQIFEEPDFLTRKQNIFYRIIRKTFDYCLFDVCSDKNVQAWLLEITGIVHSSELLSLVDSVSIGMYIIDNKVGISLEDGRDFKVSKNDFLWLSNENPFELNSLHDKSSILLISCSPRA
jgi:transcriptional regulator with XRE-family HTH domain